MSPIVTILAQTARAANIRDSVTMNFAPDVAQVAETINETRREIYSVGLYTHIYTHTHNFYYIIIFLILNFCSSTHTL